VKRKLSGREKVLLGIFAIAAVVLLRGWLGKPLRLGQTTGQNGDEVRDFGEPPVVKVALLDLEAADFDPQGRNLFDYYTPPRVRQPKVERKRPPRKENPKPPPPSAPPVAPVAKAPQPGFRYLGYLGAKENLIAFFDAGGEMVHAGIGDVVQSEFKLLEFKYETVIMGYLDTKWQGQTAELKMTQR
jgi:hypothetical protein